MASGTFFEEDELHQCEKNGHFYSFDAGKVDAASPGESFAQLGEAASYLDALNAGVHRGASQLLGARCLFITLGSAWTYRRLDDRQVVANCHRQPQQDFERSLLSVDEVAAELRLAISAARAVNPSLHIVLTVSPVRHWREGALGSSRSKAHLLAAAHSVVDAAAAETAALRRETPQQGAAARASSVVSYFPAYELLVDELRDYRWYAADMLHPSSQAVDFVWTRVLKAYYEEAEAPLRARLAALHRAALHRPQQGGLATRKFAQAQLHLAAELKESHPYLELEAATAHFTAQL